MPMRERVFSGKRAWALLVAGLCLAAMGTNPRYLEELRIGGGAGDAADGGADFEKDGDIATDGVVTAEGGVVASSVRLGDDEGLVLGDENDFEIRYTGATDRLELILPDTTAGMALTPTGDCWLGGDLAVDGDIGSSEDADLLELADGELSVRGDIELPNAGYHLTVGEVTSAQGAAPNGLFRMYAAHAADSDAHGGYFLRYQYSTPSTHALYGVRSEVNAYDASLANGYGVYGRASATSAAGGSLTNAYSLYAASPGGTYRYGLYVQSVAGGTGNFAIYTNEGAVRLGDDVTSLGDGAFQGGSVTGGVDGSERGVITAWDGAGGSAPGCLRLASADGTLWYVFATDSGAVRVHDTFPQSNDSGQTVGRRTLTLLARDGFPAGTSGCASPATHVFTTSHLNVQYLAFDKDADEYGLWNVVLPDDYDGGDLSAEVTWTAAAGTAGQTVEWNVQARAFGNDDALDGSSSWGGGSAVVDELLAVDDLHVACPASAVTILGDAEAGEFLAIRVCRNADDVTDDTLAADARLLAVRLTY